MVEHTHDTDSDGGADPAEHVIVQRLDGFPALLRLLADGTYVLEGPGGEPLPSLHPGERIRITRAVAGDATYVRAGRVLDVADDHADVHVAEDRTREQQRRFVRVPTQPLSIVLALDDVEVAGELRDLSAGGVRAVADEELRVGTHVRVRLELPSRGRREVDVDVDGEVVWRGPLEDGRQAAGIEFRDTDARTERRLTNWVFQQQSRRG